MINLIEGLEVEKLTQAIFTLKSLFLWHSCLVFTIRKVDYVGLSFVKLLERRRRGNKLSVKLKKAIRGGNRACSAIQTF